MWIEDLTKALYFLNASDLKWDVCINKIENNIVYFSNSIQVPLKILVNGYNHYLKTGEIIDIGF